MARALSVLYGDTYRQYFRSTYLSTASHVGDFVYAASPFLRLSLLRL